MTDEAQLLRDYAATASEDAFTSLVQRFLPLVYGAAMRRVGGDVHRAQDVSQLVFTALARNAKALASHPDLTGWLFTTTRFLAAKVVRAEQRRQVREAAAVLTHGAMTSDESVNAAAPLEGVLDDVMMELRQLDRQIILLRFRRGLRLAEIGGQIGVSENAVQKRLDRALETLKDKLAHRGITSTAAALALAFEQQSALAMPTGLAAAATAAGLTCGASAPGLFAVSTLMAVSKLQVGIVAALALGASAGLVWQVRENAKLRAEVSTQTAANQVTVRDLNQQLTALTARATAADTDASSLRQALASANAKAAANTSDRVLVSASDEFKDVSRRASQLEREGKFSEALQLYLTFYRKLAGPQGGPWHQMAMMGIERIGKSYTPAVDALREMRDGAMEKIRGGDNNRNLVAEAAELNERLHDPQSSMALYDLLPAGDPRRQTVALVAFNAFVEARRYTDAIVGKSYASMLHELEMGTRFEARMNQGSKINHQEFVVGGTTRDIEVLAGVGRADEAKALADKLLAYNSSDATRAAIKQHLERANPGSSQ
jgi:RNA polymerase sigma factor (sigma-70 family)